MLKSRQLWPTLFPSHSRACVSAQLWPILDSFSHFLMFSCLSYPSFQHQPSMFDITNHEPVRFASPLSAYRLAFRPSHHPTPVAVGITNHAHCSPVTLTRIPFGNIAWVLFPSLAHLRTLMQTHSALHHCVGFVGSTLSQHSIIIGVLGMVTQDLKIGFVRCTQ